MTILLPLRFATIHIGSVYFQHNAELRLWLTKAVENLPPKR